MSIQERLRAASTARESDARLLCVQAASALDAKDAEIERLREALAGALKSFEAYHYRHEPKPVDQWDEYDHMMAPLWKAAWAALTPPHPEQGADFSRPADTPNTAET